MRRQFVFQSRPQSAKPGYKGYWGQASQSQFQQQENASKSNHRKNIKLMKPDLTTNDFARILPKKIYQDKQRLYSQALNLKQNLNQTIEQNIRLKTRITILQKEKDKLTKHIEAGRENTTVNKVNSRVNIYSNKSAEKENMMIRNLKKMVREGKQENDFLKQEAAKIKKAIKYTKINELEIQRKMMQQQNKRLAALLDQLNQQLSNQQSYERQMAQLKKYLESQEEANKQLSQANIKYMEYIQQIEEKIVSEGERFHGKQNKLQRQLALNKRKMNEALKQAEDLRRQLNSIKDQAGSRQDSKKPKITRPASSNPYKSQGGLMGVRLTTETKKQEGNKQNQNIKNMKLQNQQLKQELSRTKVKLQQTQRQIKKQKQIKQKSSKRESQQLKLKSENEIQSSKNGLNSEVGKLNRKQQNRKQNNFVKGTQNQQNSHQKNKKQDSEENYNQNYDEQQQNYEENYESDEEANEFSKFKQPKRQNFNQFKHDSSDKNQIDTSKNLSNQKQPPEIDQYRKDFQAEQEQQPLYIKEEASPNKKAKQDKSKTNKSKADKSQGKKKKEKKQGQAFKPDKKILSQIKQLLTYRMKAQRYPYQELKRDIQEAKEKQFSSNDLKGMFINQPFYLTQSYCEALIQYCFETQKPRSDKMISNQSLLLKLRKVIDNFSLIQQKQEQQMLLRIAQMVTQYPQQLESAFQKIKNGEQTVAKGDLMEMFQNLQLESKYVQMIVQQLSLCSADLDHLNFIGFFERFYVENMSGVQNGQIDEEQLQSSSEQISKHLKSKDTKKLRQVKQQFEDNEDLAVDEGQRISLGNNEAQYDDANIVSDDEPI